MENNALNPNDFGKGMADIGMSQTSLGASMLQNGASPDEIAAALVKNAQGDMPEGQDAVKGLLIAWGEFFGVPVSALTADGEMTPQRAAEIVASGVPTSEAKLVQYVAAKAFLTLTKEATDAGATPSLVPEKLAGPTGNWNKYTYSEAVIQTSASGKLINADKAIIDVNKLTSYALNTEHPVGGNKAKVFESALGYNQSNVADLITKVQDGIKNNPVKMLILR